MLQDGVERTIFVTQTRDSKGSLEKDKERPRVLECEICAVEYKCWHSSALEEPSDLI